MNFFDSPMTSDKNLRLGERALRDNVVPIRFNKLSEKSSKTHANDLPKHIMVKVAIRTEYFGINGKNVKEAKSGDCSVGYYKCSHKLDHIQDIPHRSVIKAQ